MAKKKATAPPLMFGSDMHEVCECGHCRCEHESRYAACTVGGCDCSRYDWPGPDARLPADHARGVNLTPRDAT